MISMFVVQDYKTVQSFNGFAYMNEEALILQ